MSLHLLDGTTTDERERAVGNIVDVTGQGVSLTPSESNAIYQCIKDEQDSYECQSSFAAINTVADLMRAVARFAERMQARISEVGFGADISTDLQDPDNFDFLNSGALVWHPRITIVERLAGNYDANKDAWETQHGLADGKAYAVDPHGNRMDVDGHPKYI